jgi:hypothetical protein
LPQRIGVLVELPRQQLGDKHLAFGRRQLGVNRFNRRVGKNRIQRFFKNIVLYVFHIVSVVEKHFA